MIKLNCNIVYDDWDEEKDFKFNRKDNYQKFWFWYEGKNKDFSKSFNIYRRHANTKTKNRMSRFVFWGTAKPKLLYDKPMHCKFVFTDNGPFEPLRMHTKYEYKIVTICRGQKVERLAYKTMYVEGETKMTPYDLMPQNDSYSHVIMR